MKNFHMSPETKKMEKCSADPSKPNSRGCDYADNSEAFHVQASSLKEANILMEERLALENSPVASVTSADYDYYEEEEVDWWSENTEIAETTDSIVKMRELMKTKDPLFYEGLAVNPNTPEEILNEIYVNSKAVERGTGIGTEWIRERVLNHENASMAMLVQSTLDGYDVSKLPNVDSKVLIDTVRSKASEDIRSKALAKLVERDPETAAAVVADGKVPLSIIADSNSNLSFMDAIAKERKSNYELLTLAYKAGSDNTKIAALRHPNFPVALMKQELDSYPARKIKPVIEDELRSRGYNPDREVKETPPEHRAAIDNSDSTDNRDQVKVDKAIAEGVSRADAWRALNSNNGDRYGRAILENHEKYSDGTLIKAASLATVVDKGTYGSMGRRLVGVYRELPQHHQLQAVRETHNKMIMAHAIIASGQMDKVDRDEFLGAVYANPAATESTRAKAAERSPRVAGRKNVDDLAASDDNAMKALSPKKTRQGSAVSYRFDTNSLAERGWGENEARAMVERMGDHLFGATYNSETGTYTGHIN